MKGQGHIMCNTVALISCHIIHMHILGLNNVIWISHQLVYAWCDVE